MAGTATAFALAPLGWWFLAAAGAALQCTPARAANASEPHPHQGEIPRLKLEGKPNVKLSNRDFEAIEAGKLWTHSVEANGVGRGIGIRDIAAPPGVVFGQVSDLEGYVGKVPMLTSLQVYSSSRRGSMAIEKAKYIVNVLPGYNFEYFVEHHVAKNKWALLFFLDYDRHSDFRDIQGRWYLEPHPSKADWTRAYYQCDLKLWGYAPTIVKTILTTKGLVSAVGWVKRASEKRAPVPMAAFALPARTTAARAGEEPPERLATGERPGPAASAVPLEARLSSRVPLAVLVAALAAARPLLRSRGLGPGRGRLGR